ncbi:hypothetical protein [Vitreoscilla stercoraria]|uniref:DUF2997 domain-containing protein n=1 Tax=Vitreoscilla stercoraria TaxID=61 RepID=A0ABY4EDR5_VITST|nr:hypothetical protein [Vitreoscilla stercoraria]UOO93364.1 hypothetical protein LVJ81_04875 [Vitreoscilla stercoraria]
MSQNDHHEIELTYRRNGILICRESAVLESPKGIAPTEAVFKASEAIQKLNIDVRHSAILGRLKVNNNDY